MSVDDSTHPPDRAPLDFAAAGALLSHLFGGADDGESRTNPDEMKGYVLDAVLGRGAGGTVYRAYREGRDQPVAIKILHRPAGVSADSQQSQRAWRELQVLSDLRLPCLPRVLDYGSHPRGLFIVTEFVEGLHLDLYCRERGLDRRPRVELLARTAECVQMLHERGVIHRDLKPSNILIDGHGQPFIIDLGLAAVLAEGLDPTHTLTTEGTPIGTPAFMAPEQARGERVGGGPSSERDMAAPRHVRTGGDSADWIGVTTRADVYGLGATAYVVLTGQTPHDMNASLHEAVRRVAQDPPRDPRGLDANLPRALGAVLSKACAADAGNRYATAAEFAEDLRRWLRGEPVTAGSGVRARLVRAVRSRPIAMTSLAAGVAGVMVGGGTFLGYAEWAARLPEKVAIVDDGQTAILLSANQQVLHTWKSSHGMFAGTLLRAPVVGGNPLIILGGLDHQVAVYSLGDLERPLWFTRGTSRDIAAPGLPHDDGDYYNAHAMHVEDVFDDVTPEIITLHKHRDKGRTAISVYTLSGELRSRIWHSGHLDIGVWDSTTRTYLTAGVCNSATEGQEPFVHVALGVRLVEVKDAWIATACPHAVSPEMRRVTPEWYGYVYPRELGRVFSNAVLTEEATEPGRRVMRLKISHLNQTDRVERSLMLHLDSAGKALGPIVMNDAARTVLGEQQLVPEWRLVVDVGHRLELTHSQVP